MAFAVVVDVPPMAAATTARAIATCNAALGPDQCVLSGASSGGDARWYAVVRFEDDGAAKLSVELFRGDRGGSRVASSELEFKERDSPEERWASVGVVVAALVLAQPLDRERVEDEPQTIPTTAVPVASAGSKPSVRSAPWLRLDLGLTVGSEVRSTPLRFGPLMRVGLSFASLPVFAFASGAYTIRASGSTDLTWLTGSMGAGAQMSFAHERAALAVRAELVLETLSIQATEGERSESARRTRIGPRLGLDLSGYWAKNWALVVGAEAGVLGPRVVIEVSGHTEELPPFAWGLLSAVRYDFR
ncbi:MAG TPA: hypothetical protein VER12_02100 [Polyangiaceae bacterium]|nr:hypothetical protein [Polyangiaceae bacterium]